MRQPEKSSPDTCTICCDTGFFREIDRADELGSGMRKMMLYGKKYGGADPQLIEGDNFRMVISVPEFGENPAKPVRIVPTPQVTAHVAGEVTGEVFQVLHVLAEGARTRSEAQAELGLKGQANFRDRYLVLATGAGLVEMTIPGKPRSRLQKYRLTAKGRALLGEAAKDAEKKDR